MTDTGSSPESRASESRFGAVTAQISPTNEDRRVGERPGSRTRPDRRRGGRISSRWVERLRALRTKAGGAGACLVAFDLLNLNGEDLSVSARSRSADMSCRDWSPAPTTSCSAKPWRPRARSCSLRRASWAWRGSCRSAQAADIGAGRAAAKQRFAAWPTDWGCARG